jgi:voltage-gated potassium channel
MSPIRNDVGAADAGPYQLFMLTLCVWALLLLATSIFVHWDSSTRTILNYADTVVCGLFFLDFLITLARAEKKLKYLATWGWIDLLSSIPTIDALRWGRAARLMRILRVLRGVKSARALTHFVVGRRAESAFLASMLVALLLLVSGSIAVLEFEIPGGGNITNAEDAMWWAVSTMSTVGYGDRFPITSEGRLVAFFLMAAGVGLFGTVSGAVASWFLSPAAEETDVDLAEIKALLVELRSARLARHGFENQDPPT